MSIELSIPIQTVSFRYNKSDWPEEYFKNLHAITNLIGQKNTSKIYTYFIYLESILDSMDFYSNEEEYVLSEVSNWA